MAGSNFASLTEMFHFGLTMPGAFESIPHPSANSNQIASATY
jgi:hypothetical protein